MSSGQGIFRIAGIGHGCMPQSRDSRIGIRYLYQESCMEGSKTKDSGLKGSGTMKEKPGDILHSGKSDIVDDAYVKRQFDRLISFDWVHLFHCAGITVSVEEFLERLGAMSGESKKEAKRIFKLRRD